MIRAIFIILITCIVLAIGGFFAKEKFGLNVSESFNIDKITGGVTKDPAQTPEHHPEKPKKDDTESEVYFLTEKGQDVSLSTTKKDFKTSSDKFRSTMEALFSGPNGFEKIAGVYSEIPPETKLLGIKEDKNSYTINISDDFEKGGGADSMKIRVKQLVTTATQAADGKDVYLEIEGKRVEYVGGEGIIILQPLQRNL
ncbi:MAG: GerMN domain-containing protein [bacterium]|nr:GerMN domain-containing protein [bacterium]